MRKFCSVTGNTTILAVHLLGRMNCNQRVTHSRPESWTTAICCREVAVLKEIYVGHFNDDTTPRKQVQAFTSNFYEPNE